MARAGAQRGGERIAVGVSVVGQHIAGHGGALGKAERVADGHRDVVDRLVRKGRAVVTGLTVGSEQSAPTAVTTCTRSAAGDERRPTSATVAAAAEDQPASAALAAVAAGYTQPAFATVTEPARRPAVTAIEAIAAIAPQ